jgi:hypothetical protein
MQSSRHSDSASLVADLAVASPVAGGLGRAGVGERGFAPGSRMPHGAARPAAAGRRLRLARKTLRAAQHGSYTPAREPACLPGSSRCCPRTTVAA